MATGVDISGSRVRRDCTQASESRVESCRRNQTPTSTHTTPSKTLRGQIMINNILMSFRVRTNVALRCISRSYATANSAVAPSKRYSNLCKLLFHPANGRTSISPTGLSDQCHNRILRLDASFYRDCDAEHGWTFNRTSYRSLNRQCPHKRDRSQKHTTFSRICFRIPT
jgi:hypothetical protein